MKRLLLSLALATVSVCSTAAEFKLFSPELKANSMMPSSFEFNSFGCTGLNSHLH